MGTEDFVLKKKKKKKSKVVFTVNASSQIPDPLFLLLHNIAPQISSICAFYLKYTTDRISLNVWAV